MGLVDSSFAMNLFSIYISLVLFYLHRNSLEERSMKMI